MEHEDLNGGLRRTVLSGRVYFNGVDEIVGQLSSLLASASANALVDLTQATLICPMGIGALTLSAKNMQQRGGRMAVVVDDGTVVSTTLISVGIDSLLPVFTSLPDAKKALLH